MDLNAIKAKLNSLQNVTTKQTNLWKPEAGQQVIRIVPNQHNRSFPFIELYFHYNLGGRGILSPISFGRPDPIVEFAEKLKQTGSKDDWKMGKKMEPTMRCYVPIIVRGKEMEGVKFWGFGKSVYQELLGFMADPDYGDISDPMSGRDIVVEFKTADQTGRSYPETSIRMKPNQTPITDSKEVLAKIQNQPNILEIFKEKSYEELEKDLEKYLDPDSQVEDTKTKPAAETGKSSSKTSGKSADIDSVSLDDVGAAFDQLFNK